MIFVNIFLILFLICRIKAQKLKCQFNVGICYDVSGSIEGTQFLEMKNFMNNYYKALGNKTDSFIPLSIVLFGTKTITEILYSDFDAYDKKSKILDAINNIKYEDLGLTFIETCLKTIYDMPKPNTDKNILLVMTDGKVTTKISIPLIKQKSDDMLRNGYVIYAIGVGNVEVPTMEEIVGNHSERIFHTDSISNINNLVEGITTNICEDISPKCNSPDIIDGDIDASNCKNISFGKTCKIQCPDRKEQYGEDPMCGENGEFTSMPKCVRFCHFDQIKNTLTANMSVGTCDNVLPQKSCKIECKNETEQYGADPICGENGEFTSMPKCELSFPIWGWVVVILGGLISVTAIIVSIILWKRKHKRFKTLGLEFNNIEMRRDIGAELVDPEIAIVVV